MSTFLPSSICAIYCTLSDRTPDDIIFEIELIKQIEINIDYILMLVKKYHDSHCDDIEVFITIQKAIDASPELRNKKELIETLVLDNYL